MVWCKLTDRGSSFSWALFTYIASNPSASDASTMSGSPPLTCRHWPWQSCPLQAMAWPAPTCSCSSRSVRGRGGGLGHL